MSYKKQELLILHQPLVSLHLFDGICIVIFWNSCVVLIFFFSSSCVIFPMLTMSFDCPFLIAHSVFSSCNCIVLCMKAGKLSQLVKIPCQLQFCFSNCSKTVYPLNNLFVFFPFYFYQRLIMLIIIWSKKIDKYERLSLTKFFYNVYRKYKMSPPHDKFYMRKFLKNPWKKRNHFKTNSAVTFRVWFLQNLCYLYVSQKWN